MTKETAHILRERIRQLEAELAELRATMTVLISELYTAVHELERWQISQEPDAIERLKLLRDCIVEHFSLEELKTMCFDLGIDYDSLEGSGKSDKARELVLSMNRVGRCPELVAYCKENRPNARFLLLPQDRH